MPPLSATPPPCSPHSPIVSGIHLGILTEVTRTKRNLRKVRLLLQAFERSAKPIDYYALDLSRDELERTLAELPQFQHVACHGLLGTYDDGREWLKDVGDRPKCILHLGSSIGELSQQPRVPSSSRWVIVGL